MTSIAADGSLSFDDERYSKPEQSKIAFTFAVKPMTILMTMTKALLLSVNEGHAAMLKNKAKDGEVPQPVYLSTELCTTSEPFKNRKK